MLSPQHIAALEALVGPEGLVREAGDLAAYEQAARYGGGEAALVVRPADTAQVSSVVAYCVREGLSFIPQGGNTGLVLGSTPDRSGGQIVLSLDRLKARFEIDVADRTARVGAGVRLSALNAALEPHGLFLPIDLGSDPMIGGMAATNTGGARFLRYGDMRRHVLGLELVLADAAGTVLRLGDGLRKDNAALDLRQVVVGSCGALGVITEVMVEVKARPTQTAAALLIPRDEDAVLDLLLAFEKEAGEYLTAFEGMSRAAMSHALKHVASLRNPFAGGEIPAYAVLVELSRTSTGGASLDEVLERALTGLFEREDAPLADAVMAPPERSWALRHSLSEGLRASGPVTGFDLSFRRSQVMAFRREAIAMLAGEFGDYEVCDFGHIGDGGVHFNLLRAEGPASPERAAALNDAVLDLAVRKYGGSFSGEHGIGRANQAAYDAYTPDDLKRLSGAVVDLFSKAPVGAARFGPADA
ncbi:FAD-binding oxidoreductase [Caulobacter sp. NIBR2454]|uniref:FAD-binding oxidoreductase n=1 Tax=Caulobacter sp. NIBR2454 TaxID=3015996 RepID=UPI0022B5E9D0|nr:FAD-binding oxidoreductase [Caulobacter sp. NIBR2454]